MARIRHSLPLLLGPLLGVLSSVAFAGSDPPNRSYGVGGLDPRLIEDADAVVREDWTSLEVFDRKEARLKVVIAVTIFDAQGRDHGSMTIPYGRFEQIKKFDGRILDDKGDEIRDLEDSDVHDYSAVSGYSLAEDSRARSAELYYDRYPYTVEYTYEIAYKGHLSWPSWIAQGGKDAVEHTYFEITLPEGEQLRYWTNSDSTHPRVTDDDGKKTYVWEASALPLLSKDMMEEDLVYRTVVVLTAPSLFQIDDFPGDMTSWKSFGQWSEGLFHGRDQLPASAVADVHRLVGPEESARERVAKLYKYMQNRTRYVSIQLGIGGWQPFDATYVHERGYGDCKALSNYMVALLKEAGVPAYPVLIYGGTAGELYLTGFPSQQFNHVIVCVPLDGDSLWLECTDQTVPAGHLGQRTENRFGILLSAQGGQVVWTPSSCSRDNAQHRNARVMLTGAGTVKATLQTSYSGDQQDRVRSALGEQGEDERRKWLVNHVGVPNAVLNTFGIVGLDGRLPKVDISLDLTVPKYGSASGSRIFFQPNFMERRTYIPRENKTRKSPVRFGYPYRDSDSILYVLPKGYQVETLPSPLDLESSFGAFHARTVRMGDSALVYTRTLEIRNAVVPAASYEEYRRFFTEIVREDRAQAVLVKRGE
ncbi:MAG: DUF3857 domain-containing protein [Bacteroidota bacterium]